MQVFAYEKKDGLEEKILSSKSITLAGTIKPANKKVVLDDKFVALADINSQFDLFPITDILVSSGWNLNDDIFLPAELWNARLTPIHKQINYMHDDSSIIGHITAQRFLKQSDGSEITSEEELVDDVDIETEGVLYTCLRDAGKAEIVQKLVSEIPQDLWAVSMECLFNQFDYGLADENSLSIIPRTEATAWLTKNLRAYGGTGEFDGKKLGRVLRNFTFSGKGVVDKPANPRSKFKNLIVEGSINMDLEKENENLKTEIASLKSQLEESVKTVASLKALKEESVKAIEVAKADYDKLAEELKIIQEKFAQIEAAKKKAERKNKLSMCELDEARQEEILAKFSNASDDIFDEMVKLVEAAKMKKKEVVKCDETDADTKKVEEVKIEEAKVVDSTVASTVTDSNNDELKKVLASFAQEAFKNSKKGRK